MRVFSPRRPSAVAARRATAGPTTSARPDPRRRPGLPCLLRRPHRARARARPRAGSWARRRRRVRRGRTWQEQLGFRAPLGFLGRWPRRGGSYYGRGGGCRGKRESGRASGSPRKRRKYNGTDGMGRSVPVCVLGIGLQECLVGPISLGLFSQRLQWADPKSEVGWVKVGKATFVHY